MVTTTVFVPVPTGAESTTLDADQFGAFVIGLALLIVLAGVISIGVLRRG